MAVWAETGTAEKIITSNRMKVVIRLCMLELYSIPDLELVYPAGMDFQDISGW